MAKGDRHYDAADHQCLGAWGGGLVDSRRGWEAEFRAHRCELDVEKLEKALPERSRFAVRLGPAIDRPIAQREHREVVWPILRRVSGGDRTQRSEDQVPAEIVLRVPQVNRSSPSGDLEQKVRDELNLEQARWTGEGNRRARSQSAGVFVLPLEELFQGSPRGVPFRLPSYLLRGRQRVGYRKTVEPHLLYTVAEALVEVVASRTRAATLPDDRTLGTRVAVDDLQICGETYLRY
ncbi:hypothetical protein ACU8MW_08600 [Rhizobium leguminosarum]